MQHLRPAAMSALADRVKYEPLGPNLRNSKPMGPKPCTQNLIKLQITANPYLWTLHPYP